MKLLSNTVFFKTIDEKKKYTCSEQIKSLKNPTINFSSWLDEATDMEMQYRAIAYTWIFQVSRENET